MSSAKEKRPLALAFNSNGKERGASLIELLVSIAIGAMILLGLFYFFQWSFRIGQQMLGRYKLSQSLSELEVLWRKELDQLRFAPECPGLLPAELAIKTGGDVSGAELSALKRGVTLFRSGRSVAELDLRSLKTQGIARFTPTPPKNLSRLLVGSDIVQISALLPVAGELESFVIAGDLPQALDGRREQLFLITDCSQSWLVRGSRHPMGYELSQEDWQDMMEVSGTVPLQVYAVMERLLYLQREGEESFLVQDYLDGQTFLRTPHIVLMEASLSSDHSLLLIRLLAGDQGAKRVELPQQNLGEFTPASIKVKNSGNLREHYLLLPVGNR